MTLTTGWREVALAEVATLSSGGTPEAKNTTYYGGDIPWAIIGDLNDGLVLTTARSITRRGFDNSSAKVVPVDTILLGMYGSIGKLGIAGVPMATNQAIATIRPGDAIDHRYLFHYLLGQRRDLDRQGKGAAQRNISQTVLKPWPVRFPEDLDEQRRIVELLEDHLSRLDAARESVNSSIRRSSALVASSLSAIVAAGSAGSPISSVGAEAERVEYGSSAKCHAPPSDGDIPVLRMGNLKDGTIDPRALKFLPKDHPEFPKLLLAPGDLLFNRTNSAELVGKSAVFDSTSVTSFASYLIRVRFSASVDPRWANIVINSPQGRAHIASVATQQVGQANVNGTKLKAFPLPMPPLSQQRELVAAHERTSHEARRLKAVAEDSLKRSEALRRSLLAAAFSGQLTTETAIA